MRKLAILFFVLIFTACSNAKQKTEIQEIIPKSKRIPMSVEVKEKDTAKTKKEKSYIDKIYTAPKPESIVTAYEMPYVEYIF